MKKLIACFIFLALFIGTFAQQPNDRKFWKNIWVKDTVKGGNLQITNIIELGTVGYLLEDTAVTEFGYDDDDFIVSGAVMGKKLNLPDTLHAFRVITDWVGTGAGSGFNFDILADTSFNDATPLITVANNLTIGTNGVRGDDSIDADIPPGYYYWAEVDGAPSVTPTELSISLLHYSSRGFTRSDFYGTAPECITYDALSRYYFEQDGVDEEGVNNLTPNSVTYGTTSPPQGTYYGVSSSSQNWDVPSISYGDEITMAFWVKVTNAGSTKTVFDSDGLKIEIQGTDDQLTVKTDDGNTESTYETGNDVDVATNTWIHVAVVIDRLAPSIIFYINGVAEGGSGVIQDDFDNVSTGYLGSNEVPGAWLYGSLDDFQIYLWKLSETEVNEIMDTPGTEATKCE